MKWEGKFSSLSLPPGIASGKIIVDNIDLNSSGYTTTATITYTGIYMKGKTSQTQVTAQGDTMEVTLDGYNVVFTIEKRSHNMITGSYKIKGRDKGQFYLQPAGSPPIDNQQCVIQ